MSKSSTPNIFLFCTFLQNQNFLLMKLMAGKTHFICETEMEKRKNSWALFFFFFFLSIAIGWLLLEFGPKQGSDSVGFLGDQLAGSLPEDILISADSWPVRVNLRPQQVHSQQLSLPIKANRTSPRKTAGIWLDQDERSADLLLPQAFLQGRVHRRTSPRGASLNAYQRKRKKRVLWPYFGFFAVVIRKSRGNN